MANAATVISVQGTLKMLDVKMMDQMTGHEKNAASGALHICTMLGSEMVMESTGKVLGDFLSVKLWEH